MPSFRRNSKVFSFPRMVSSFSTEDAENYMGQFVKWFSNIRSWSIMWVYSSNNLRKDFGNSCQHGETSKLVPTMLPSVYLGKLNASTGSWDDFFFGENLIWFGILRLRVIGVVRCTKWPSLAVTREVWKMEGMIQREYVRDTFTLEKTRFLIVSIAEYTYLLLTIFVVFK